MLSSWPFEASRAIEHASSDCSPFSLWDAVRFSTLAQPLGPFLDSGICTAKEFVLSVASLSATFSRLVLFLVVCVIKLGTGAMPALLSLSRSIIEFHRTQLTVADLLFEAMFVLSMALVFLYNKQILEYLWHLERRLQKTSKEATRDVMRVAPHMAFFFLALIVSVLGRKFLKPLSSESVLPVFSLVIPIFRTVYGSLLLSTEGTPGVRALSSSFTINLKAGEDKILQHKGHADLETLAASGRRTILLWVVLALYHSLATFLSRVPFVVHLLYYLPFLREMALVVLVWAQLSPVFIEIAYESASPLLYRAGSLIPTSRSEEERGLAMVSLARGMGLINESTESFFKALCVESTSFVLIVAFCFIPSPSHIVSHTGMIVISLLLPAVRAAGVVAQWDVREPGKPELGASEHSSVGLTETATSMITHLSRSLSFGTDSHGSAQGQEFEQASSSSDSPQECTFQVGVFTTGRKIRKPSASTISMILKQKRWLEYFTCIAAVWLLRCYHFTMWPSVTMMLSWYLSHSLWAGARPWSRYIVKGVRLCLMLLTPIALFRMVKGVYSITEKVVTPRKAHNIPASARTSGQGLRSISVADEGKSQGHASSSGHPKRSPGSADSPEQSKTVFSSREGLPVPSSASGSSAPDLSPFLTSSTDVSVDSSDERRQSLSLSTPRLLGHEIANIDTGDSCGNRKTVRRRSSSRNKR